MITEICMSGAMHRGIVEIGALRAFEELGILDIKKAVGTSIGTIVLFMFIIGYSCLDIFEAVFESDVALFGDFDTEDISIYQKSVFKGLEIKNWIIEMASKKIKNFETVTTLQLYNETGVHLIATTVCLETGLEYIDYINFPEVLVIDQLMATISLPYIFRPCIINLKTFLDGGLIENFPVHLIEDNIWSLGIEIKKEEQWSLDTENIIQYTKRIVKAIAKDAESVPIINNPFQERSIVTINCKESEKMIINFHMSKDDKFNYYKLGLERTKNSEAYKKITRMLHERKFKEVVDYISVVDSKEAYSISSITEESKPIEATI